MSKKQDCTVMSFSKAEYVALSASCAQVMWMRTQLKDYVFNYNKIPLYYDSQSAIAISCNPVQHSQASHYAVRYRPLLLDKNDLELMATTTFSDGDTVELLLLKELRCFWKRIGDLTKEDRESQLYDDFEHFRQNKGETIHDYYVRTDVILFDVQCFLLNISFTIIKTFHRPHIINPTHSGWTPHNLIWDFSNDNLIENLTNTLALLTQSYKTFLPQTNNQLRTSSNPRNQATVQDGRVVVQNVQGRQNRGQGNNARGAGAAGHIARNCTQPKHPQNSEYFKDKMLLMQAQENRVVLDEEQLLFLAGGQDNAIDEDVDEQPVQDLALNVDNVFQADDYPVYDEACPSYDSDILSEVQDHDHFQDAICEHHEEHGMQNDVQQVKPNVLALGKYTIDVEPIPPCNRNNREVHLHYLRHLKESVDTLREIVEEAKVERPLDRSLASACRYTKHSQELLEYVFGTCPKVFNQQEKASYL
ncbi:hypothetical protein Tco_1174444 [Tanacetum coccineum]